MRMLVIMAVLLSGFYIGATKVVLTQLQGLQDFYSHLDETTSQIVQPITNKPQLLGTTKVSGQ